jgi:5'-nucleotidase
MRSWIASLAFIALSASPASARNIVLSNDDGLTSNVLALYHALKAQGHDVIVSVPCTNQSGMGAATYFGRSLPALTAACRNSAASAGDPGAGPMTRPGLPANDFHYVGGTPVMAMLYGIDVAGRKRWNKEPDLVLSGPNEGQNVGAIILGSGTVSNAQYAAIRGIPAIALSAGMNSTGSETLANPVSAVVAKRSAELVARLDKQSGGKRMLPAGIALNVNFPDNPETSPWRLTRIGTYNAYIVRFSENMARDASPAMAAMASQHGSAFAALPGITMDMNAEPPLPAQSDDESVVYRSAIAVSPMRAGYDAGNRESGAVSRLLRTLFSARKDR